MASIFVVLVLLGFSVGASFAVSDDFKSKVDDMIGRCDDKGTTDKKALFSKAWNEDALPESEEDKCFFACVLKALKALENGKFSLDVFNFLTEQRFKDQADINAAQKINARCIERDDDKDDCAATYEMMKCYTDESKKLEQRASKYQTTETAGILSGRTGHNPFQRDSGYMMYFLKNVTCFFNQGNGLDISDKFHLTTEHHVKLKSHHYHRHPHSMKSTGSNNVPH